MLSVTVMTFVDRMFLNWTSSTSMAAAFSGSIVWWALICLPLGVCSYANTFVSQYFGDGQPERIGPSVWQSVWVALISTPLFLLFVPLAPTIFAVAEHGVEAAKQETVYFQILCIGGPGMLIAAALSALYSGLGRTWVVMLVDTAVVIVNLALDYFWIFSREEVQDVLATSDSGLLAAWHSSLIFIFGENVFLGLGIAGAAWATVVALWIKVVIYLYLILQSINREKYHTWAGMSLDRPLFRRLMFFGFPSGVQMLLDVLGWTVFVLLVARLGHIEHTATTLAFSISSVAFMPIWGFGMGTSILVGQKLGEDRDDLASRATWTLLWISLGYMAVISALYVLTPGIFLDAFFGRGSDSQEVQNAIYSMAVNLLCFVAAYNLLDAVLMVFVNALKGAGDTRYILNVSIVMAAMLAGCSWLAVEVLQLGIYACWSIAIAWVWGMGGLFFYRYQTGQWRLMRVIDAQHKPTLHEQASPQEASLVPEPNASAPTE
jgi:MATE family multidrug resistance protein